MELLIKRPVVSWALAAIVLFACFLYLFHDTVVLQGMPDGFVPGGLYGDQAFYLWAIKRGQNATSLADFFAVCSWSQAGCMDLRSIPHEWLNFFLMGKLGNAIGASDSQLVTGFYSVAMVLNLVAAFFFIGVVSRSALWSLALAPSVAYHTSVVSRLSGHLSLSAIWQLLFTLGFVWLTLDAVHAKRTKSALIFSTFAGVFMELTMLQGTYFFAFAVPLIPMLTFAFIKARAIATPRLPFIRQAALSLTPFFTLAALMLWQVRYIALGADGIKAASTHIRSSSNVNFYSARLGDFFAPFPDTLLSRAIESLGLSTGYNTERGEVLAYLGAGLLLVTVVTVVHLYKTQEKSPGPQSKWRKLIPRLPSATGALFALALGAIFFSTPAGGLILNRCLSRGLRCFVRMTPFCAAFLSAAIAVHWRSKKAVLGIVLAVLAFTISIADIKTHPSLGVLHLTQNVDPKGGVLTSELNRLCPQGSLDVDPPMPDFIWGSYLLIYLAEKSHCLLNGIGPITHPKNLEYPKAVGKFVWDPKSPHGLEGLSIVAY